MPKTTTLDFVYSHRVHFYETDCMGIVHHANFLRFFEEARVAWLRFRGLQRHHAPYGEVTLAVLESACRHHRSAYLDDELKIRLQLKLERLKIKFAYVIHTARYEAPIVTGETLHVPLNRQLKVMRLPPALKAELESEPWTETWPSNL